VALALSVLAMETCGVEYQVSVRGHRQILPVALNERVVQETEDELLDRLPLYKREFDRVRVPGGSVSLALRERCNQYHWVVLHSESLANGRLELLNYLREQSVSQVLHRYGNLIAGPRG
jgi:RHH-type proline utilization regulon transcriptional repressor/proline dehydrogenase/delta 1-pyrroline-5-carboxylate dehydrogenase